MERSETFVNDVGKTRTYQEIELTVFFQKLHIRKGGFASFIPKLVVSCFCTTWK